MAYFSTKRQITFKYWIHWNINIPKKFLHKKITGTGATFVKKNSCLVAGIVSFDIVKSWNSILFNSEFFLLTHIYYLTSGFNASTRTFNLLTRAFNLATRNFWIWTRNLWIWTCNSWIWTRNLWIWTRNS